jgi:hypothetical protein
LANSLHYTALVYVPESNKNVSISLVFQKGVGPAVTC